MPQSANCVHIGGIGVVAMGKFRYHQPHAANIAARHHGPHMAHQRIAGIAVIHRTNPPRLARGQHQIFSLGLGHRHRLFAQHVKARLQESLGNLVMGGVWRRHRDQINAVGAAAFACQHLAPIAIGALGRKAQLLAKGAARSGVVVQRACGKAVKPIKASCKPMRWADLAAFAAADHTPIQFFHA